MQHRKRSDIQKEFKDHNDNIFFKTQDVLTRYPFLCDVMHFAAG